MKATNISFESCNQLQFVYLSLQLYCKRFPKPSQLILRQVSKNRSCETHDHLWAEPVVSRSIQSWCSYQPHQGHPAHQDQTEQRTWWLTCKEGTMQNYSFWIIQDMEQHIHVQIDAPIRETVPVNTCIKTEWIAWLKWWLEKPFFANSALPITGYLLIKFNL